MRHQAFTDDEVWDIGKRIQVNTRNSRKGRCARCCRLPADSAWARRLTWSRHISKRSIVPKSCRVANPTNPKCDTQAATPVLPEIERYKFSKMLVRLARSW